MDALEIAAKAVQLYAESHPRPPHVNQVQAAEMMQISQGTVSRMIRDGHLRLNAAGKIPISEVDRMVALGR